MRTMSCRDIQREIEEAGLNDSLDSVANDHVKDCAGCRTFYVEQFKLRRMVSSLGTVEAPGDFDFRLRARLAGEKPGAGQPFKLFNLSFGLRSAAFAAVLLLIASALFVANMRREANNSFVAQESAKGVNVDAKPQGTELTAPEKAVGKFAPQSDIAKASLNATAPRGRSARAGRRGLGASQVALANDSRLTSRDMASTQAPILKPGNLVANAGHNAFPVDASPQSLKVSLDNGRGSSKTISLPGVSFGSQQVLTQNASPLVASTRGAW